MTTLPLERFPGFFFWGGGVFLSQPLPGSQIRQHARTPGYSGDQDRMPCLQETFCLLVEYSQEFTGEKTKAEAGL